MSCWSVKRRKPSCPSTILHLHWNTRQQLPWSCLHSKERHSSTFKDSMHRKQNDDISSHFHAQRHALQHTAMFLLQYPFIFLYLCFSTPFLPQSLLWASYFLVFNLDLMFFSEQILLPLSLIRAFIALHPLGRTDPVISQIIFQESASLSSQINWRAPQPV